MRLQAFNREDLDERGAPHAAQVPYDPFEALAGAHAAPAQGPGASHARKLRAIGENGLDQCVEKAGATHDGLDLGDVDPEAIFREKGVEDIQQGCTNLGAVRARCASAWLQPSAPPCATLRRAGKGGAGEVGVARLQATSLIGEAQRRRHKRAPTYRVDLPPLEPQS